MLNKEHKLGKYYLIVVIIGLIVGYEVFLYFSAQKPIYQATGKISYYYPTSINNSQSNLPYTSDALTKTIADSINTRAFAEKLFSLANVAYNQTSLDTLSDVLQAKALSGSNVIQVDIFNKDVDALNQISKSFVSALNQANFVSESGPQPKIVIVDPVYVLKELHYPKPTEYAAIATAAVILIGLMIIYVFTSE